MALSPNSSSVADCFCLEYEWTSGLLNHLFSVPITVPEDTIVDRAIAMLFCNSFKSLVESVLGETRRVPGIVFHIVIILAPNISV